MTTDPKVSVLIPTYKRPRLLRRALESLQKQTLTNWEAIAVDDGAGEGIGETLLMGDERIRAFVNKGKGQVIARNTALEMAKGEYVALLDDDDWLEDTQHLQKAVQAQSREPALVYRGGWLVEFSGEDETGRTIFNATATADRLRQDNLILATGVVYPREFHSQLGVFDSGMSDYWDWDWYLRVSGAGYRLHKLRGLGVAIAQHGANMSYGSRNLERQNNLDKLSAKHGLVGIVLKDHSIIAKEEPQENPEPPLSV